MRAQLALASPIQTLVFWACWVYLTSFISPAFSNPHILSCMKIGVPQSIFSQPFSHTHYFWQPAPWSQKGLEGSLLVLLFCAHIEAYSPHWHGKDRWNCWPLGAGNLIHPSGPRVVINILWKAQCLFLAFIGGRVLLLPLLSSVLKAVLCLGRAYHSVEVRLFFVSYTLIGLKNYDGFIFFIRLFLVTFFMLSRSWNTVNEVLTLDQGFQPQHFEVIIFCCDELSCGISISLASTGWMPLEPLIIVVTKLSSDIAK